MTTTNEKLRNVAEVAARIIMGQTEEKEPQVISEELKGDQHKIDANKNNKIDAHDFKLLRSKKKVEESSAKPDFLDLDKDGDKKEPMKKASSQMKKEEAEQVEEAEIVKTATGMRVYGSSYGDSAKARRDQVKKSIDTAKGPKMKDLSDIEAEKKKKKKMSEMVATYQEQGLKGLFATLVKEEPDNETFTKEVERQKRKNAGTEPESEKAKVAKASVQAVQNEETHTKVEVVDLNDVNGVKISEIDLEERQMTEPEMKKKEEIVKSMKKGIAGFKERYGSRAKNVMYATATRIAKDKA